MQRLPRIFKYDGKPNTTAHQIQVGDLFVPKHGDRGRDVFYVDLDGQLKEIQQDGCGHGLLPPHLLSVGIDNGYSLHELLDVYLIDQIENYMFPLAYQEGVLEVRPDGYLAKAAGIAQYRGGYEDVLTYEDNELFEYGPYEQIFAYDLAKRTAER